MKEDTMLLIALLVGVGGASFLFYKRRNRNIEEAEQVKESNYVENQFHKIIVPPIVIGGAYILSERLRRTGLLYGTPNEGFYRQKGLIELN